MNLSARILRILRESGPRKTTMLRGLAASTEDFERAIGRLFLDGTVEWRGQKKARVLAAKTA